MEANEQNQEDEAPMIRIKIVGVGGAGSNIVDRLTLANLPDVGLCSLNTDQQALGSAMANDRRCIGRSVTGGLGAGGDPEVGREAALADRAMLDEICADVDLLFIVSGMGGGTGTGAAPVLAEAASRAGAVVIAFVTLPFSVERARRAQIAQQGLEALRGICNAVIPLPNDLLIQESEHDASFLDAFAKADSWIERGVRSIWAMMSKTGMINLDFSQLRKAFSRKAGKTLFGLGEGSGDDAARAAIEDLKICPMLHTPEFSKKADHLLVNIVGGPRLGMADVQSIMEFVANEFGKDANIVMGSVIDEGLGDSVEICVIGTSDVTGSAPYSPRRRLVAESKSEPEPKKSEPAPRARKPAHASSAFSTQDEFSFGNAEPKGEFENMEGYLFEGEDLDTPTFLRKGIKIPV